MSDKESIIRPRLVRLQQELKAGNAQSLDLFWQEVRERGTPLIEPVKGDENQSWLTFLWRADDELENVTVIAQFIGQRFSDGLMSHLPDTDVWYKTCRASNDLRTTYSLSPNDSLVPVEEIEDWKERISTWQHDPLNPRIYVTPWDDQDPESVETRLSVIELSSAPPQPWITPQADVPAGQVELYRLRSSILDNERRVWVYTPPGYEPDGDPYGLLVLFDGWAYVNLIPTPTILDNLLVQGLIPPLVAVLPDSLSQETRHLELACYAPFTDFLVEELVPWVRGNYNVSTEPSRVIVGGLSLGGLCAVFAGLEHPGVFGNVLSQSGSLFWRPEGETEHEWLARQFVVTDRLPLQFHLDVGLHERHSRYVGGPSLLVSNQHLRDVLQAKGYTVHYVEYNGGHDYVCWRGALAEGLLALVEQVAA